MKFDDDNFPKLLLKISECPKVLYYKGKLDESIFDKCLAVVGSRRMTSYGKKIAYDLVYGIARQGVTIVSGFMYGIDAVAHLATLDAGGRTIAVMPCGIDLVHPYNHMSLYERIVENDGLIVSEYEGTELPQIWTYPRRNRIIAGLCEAVLVVEAALNSGSLITAGYAKKFNRKLLAIPGQINSPTSEGTLDLIKKGATMITCVEDLYEILGIEMKLAVKEKNMEISDSQRAILEVLTFEPVDMDELVVRSGISAEKLGAELTMMVLLNLVVSENGKYYVN